MQTTPTTIKVPEGLAGAELPTLVEQLIHRLRIPYVIGCLGFALIIGSGLIIAELVETGDVNSAIARTLSSYSAAPPVYAYVDVLVTIAIVFYMLFTIRYMRVKIVGTEPRLVEVTSDGEDTLHRVFRPVSNIRGQIASSVLLLLVAESVQSSSHLTSSARFNNPLSIVLSLVIGCFFYLVAGTFVWVYASSLWGLYQFGRQNLHLTSYREDRLLGVGSVGSLSLVLMMSYYAVVAPIAIETVVLSPDPVGYATVVPLALLGGLMFFLPLTSIHRQMQMEKSSAEESIQDEMVRLSSGSRGVPIRRQERVSARIDLLIDLEILQLAQKRLESVPTWPYDTRTLERFTAIFLSVLGAIVSRAVLAALNL